MHVSFYRGFATETCNSLEEKAQLRPRGKRDLWSGSRLHLAVQGPQPPLLGFVCIAATAARALPEAVHPCDVGSPCFKILEPPSTETTFILVSGRSLPFSLLFHSHRAESGNKEAFKSLGNTVLRYWPKLTKKRSKERGKLVWAHPKQPVYSCTHAAPLPLPCTKAQLQRARDNTISPSLQYPSFASVKFTVF